MQQVRRYLESVAFVAVWILAGLALHLDAYFYLLLGVPLVALFQLVVRRRRLETLWVRDAVNFRLDRWGFAIAVALMAVPGYVLVVEAIPARQWPVILWIICCLAGAVCAAFALRQQNWKAARAALLPFVTVIVTGCSIMALAALANHKSPLVGPARILTILKEFLLFFAVCFLLEEVAFRGAIDSHLYQPSDERDSAAAWISAIFVSVLWGIWHLPVVPATSGAALVAVMLSLAAVHTAVGIPLSFCWRRSGTLVLPAAAHAFIDAYRDAVMQ
jgi:membrane protease YdiL (CAAX protease family)